MRRITAVVGFLVTVIACTALGGSAQERKSFWAFTGPWDALSDASLRANRGARIADGPLAALRRRVELFGFHGAKLDVRLYRVSPTRLLFIRRVSVAVENANGDGVDTHAL